MTREELRRGADLLLEERDRYRYTYRKARRFELVRTPLLFVTGALVLVTRDAWWGWAAGAWCVLAALLHLASTHLAIAQLLAADRLAKALDHVHEGLS